MTEIHNYSRRLERFRRNISKHKYGSVALKFLDHLGALGLSRVGLQSTPSMQQGDPIPEEVGWIS